MRDPEMISAKPARYCLARAIALSPAAELSKVAGLRLAGGHRLL